MTIPPRKQSVRRERDSAVAEVANLTAALVLAREGQEAERGRFDRESKRAAALGEELVASEARRKVQEEEISLVRKQVLAGFVSRPFCSRTPATNVLLLAGATF